MEEPQLKCCRKISSFSPLFQKSNKLVNLIFFFFRVQFSVIRHKKSNAETVRHSSKSRRPSKKRGASKEFIAHKGFQSLDDGRIKKHLRICVLQAQRICLTACYIRYSGASFQTRAAKRSLTLMLLTTSLHLLKLGWQPVFSGRFSPSPTLLQIFFSQSSS